MFKQNITMDTSDSDDETYRFYTNTAKHFFMKRQELEAQRREMEKALHLPDENVLDPNNDNFNMSLIEDSEQEIRDVSVVSIPGYSHTEDDIPLGVRRSKRNSRRLKGRPKQSSTSQVRNLDVIVLDDDTDFTKDSLPPIDFERYSNKKRRISEEEMVNISSDSSMNEDEFLKNDDLVTLTIEWNNGQKTTRKDFKLRRYQKFEFLFEELANMENISTNRVLLMYDFKFITPMDTPSSLNLKFYGALIGSVSATEVNHNLDHQSDTDNIPLPAGCLQVKLMLESKQTLLFTVFKHQQMDVLYQKCAEEIKCDKSKLKLTFDGGRVKPSELVSNLDIEDGDLFHVHVENS